MRTIKGKREIIVYSHMNKSSKDNIPLSSRKRSAPPSLTLEFRKEIRQFEIKMYNKDEEVLKDGNAVGDEKNRFAASLV